MTPGTEALQGAVLSIAFVVIHLILVGHDVGALFTWVSDRCTKPAPDGDRLETAMEESRKSSFLIFTRFVVFFQAGGIAYWVRSYYLSPNLKEAVFFFCTLSTYVQFMAFATRAVHVTPGRARLCCSLLYGSLVLCYLALPFIDGTHMDGNVINVQLTAIRFALAAVAMDSRMSAPWQVLLSLGQIRADLVAPSGLQHPGFTVFLQSVVLALVLVGSVILENCVRSNIRAQFHCSDAESLMFSFRRMLRGVCDGEVLLDGNLRIHSVSDCLKHLLMTSTNLHGKSFEQLLEPEAASQFRGFIKTSTSQGAQDTMTTPPCLRVSLIGAASTKVSVDLIHVPISKLYGSHEPYHLLALKEDSEGREEPVASSAASESMDQLIQLMQTKQGACASPGRPPSDVSGTSRASGLQGFLPCVTEMNLLVDTSTPSCDVRQANLRFAGRRHPERPNLRSLVLPTDWASVREALQRHADRQEEGFVMRAEQLPPVRLRMLHGSSSKYNVAHLAEIAPHKHNAFTGKLWLRFGELVEGQPSRGLARLEQIRELGRRRQRGGASSLGG